MPLHELAAPTAPEEFVVDLTNVDAVVIDVDGTLVDSNYHHTLAWYRAFQSVDARVEVWRIHRSIGMGGDELVPAVGGDDLEEKHGDELRERWLEQYNRLLPEVRPFDGARSFLRALHDAGITAVLASSSPADQVEHYLDLLDARSILDAWTTADDAEHSKPAPDLITVAMEKVGASTAVMVGDSSWDVVAAGRAGVDTWTVLTGGYAEAELREAGAVQVFDSVRELSTPLVAALTGGGSRRA